MGTLGLSVARPAADLSRAGRAASPATRTVLMAQAQWRTYYSSRASKADSSPPNGNPVATTPQSNPIGTPRRVIWHIVPVLGDRQRASGPSRDQRARASVRPRAGNRASGRRPSWSGASEVGRSGGQRWPRDTLSQGGSELRPGRGRIAVRAGRMPVVRVARNFLAVVRGGFETLTSSGQEHLKILVNLRG